MKTRKHSFILICILLCGFLQNANAQLSHSKIVEAPNPFPLTETEKAELIKASEQTIAEFLTQYSNHNLSTWSESDRNAYFKAKATKVILLFATDYYRKYYAEPEITKDTTATSPKYRPHAPYYNVRFFYDPTKEDMGVHYPGNKHEMINVQIWEEDAQALGFIVRIINWGDFFSPPKWEEGLLEKWKKEGRKPYPYQILTDSE